MITDEQFRKDVIKNNPNKDFIAKGVTYHKDMRMHLYGENLEGKLTRVDGFEKDALRELRVKYSKSNKDLFSRLGRNMDKIFSARGGSLYYNLSDELNKRAMGIAANVRDGYSVKKWIEFFWLTHAKDDPMGVVFIEIGDGVSYPVGQAYPTYKAITDIFDYPVPKGDSLDYIVMKLSSAEKKALEFKDGDDVYRFVDDANDYIMQLQSNEVITRKDLTIPNYFGRVPVMINSDIVDGKDEKYRLSLFDEVIELANHFLLKGSIKVTHEFLHGFPKYWEFGDACNECKGTGYKDTISCKACKGSGIAPMSKVSDIKILAWPATKDDINIAPNVGGYIEPSKIYYEIASNEMSLLEDAMSFTLWGATDKKKAQGPDAGKNSDPNKTATEIKDDHQPTIARLTSLSEMAEKRHKFIVDAFIVINLRQKNYGGSSVNYGRRYIVLNPDEAWQRYSTARTTGASFTVLNDLLRDYLETKYQGDPITLLTMQKLIALEPFVHLTIAQAEPLVELELDYIKKLYFWEWVNTLKNNELLIKDLDALRLMLEEFAKGKQELVKTERAEMQAETQKAAQAAANIKIGNKIDQLVN